MSVAVDVEVASSVLEVAGPSSEMQLLTGHNSYIASMAKLCKESECFTDVKIVCADGDIRAHRLVLASCSSFLSSVFLTLPEGLPEFTFIVPNIKKDVLNTFIEFLYTGQMSLHRNNAHDLQQLVHILQIDPENVRIDATTGGAGCSTSSGSGGDGDSGIAGDGEGEEARGNDENSADASKQEKERTAVEVKKATAARLVQSKITQLMAAKEKKPPNPLLRGKRRLSQEAAAGAAVTRGSSPSTSTTQAKQQKLSSSVASPAAAGPLSVITPNLTNASRLRESSSPAAHQSSSSTTEYKPRNPLLSKTAGKPAAMANHVQTSNATSSSGRSSNSLPNTPKNNSVLKPGAANVRSAGNNVGVARRGRGRPRTRGAGAGGRASSAAAVAAGSNSSTAPQSTSGFHDMANVETWKCAICKQYDPVLPAGVEPSKTEWVGCDCNRWYHQFCTGLDTVDDSFACKLVKLKCLPAE